MDVLSALERRHERGVLGKVSEDAQVYLRVVGAEQRPLGAFLGYERLPDAQAERRADGDVLEVGVRAGKPSRGGARLVVGGMDASRVRVHLKRERVHVGGLQLGELPVTQDMADDRVVVAQVLQYGGVRRIAGLRPAA